MTNSSQPPKNWSNCLLLLSKPPNPNVCVSHGHHFPSFSIFHCSFSIFYHKQIKIKLSRRVTKAGQHGGRFAPVVGQVVDDVHDGLPASALTVFVLPPDGGELGICERGHIGEPRRLLVLPAGDEAGHVGEIGLRNHPTVAGVRERHAPAVGGVEGVHQRAPQAVPARVGGDGLHELFGCDMGAGLQDAHIRPKGVGDELADSGVVHGAPWADGSGGRIHVGVA